MNPACGFPLWKVGSPPLGTPASTIGGWTLLLRRTARSKPWATEPSSLPDLPRAEATLSSCNIRETASPSTCTTADSRWRPEIGCAKEKWWLSSETAATTVLALTSTLSGGNPERPLIHSSGFRSTDAGSQAVNPFQSVMRRNWAMRASKASGATARIPSVPNASHVKLASALPITMPCLSVSKSVLPVRAT